MMPRGCTLMPHGGRPLVLISIRNTNCDSWNRAYEFLDMLDAVSRRHT